MLATEILEVLELKAKKIESDSIKGDMTQSITTTFDYSPKGKIKSCNTITEIKNKDEKILQSNEIINEYTVNNKGDIARVIEKQILDAADPVILSDTKIENKYDGKRLVKKTYIVGNKITGEDFYFYDSEGNLILKQSMNDNGVGQFVFGYDDMNILSSVMVIESRKGSDGIVPSCTKYIIERNGDGYISEIKKDGGRDAESEFFNYYTDDTITVNKGELNSEDILIGRTILYLETTKQ